MESIRNLYRIGYGPSSSHTMGPRYAAERFLRTTDKADRYEITLYGSLAATGKGHLTEEALQSVFMGKGMTINWEPRTFLSRHPNAMKFCAFDANDAEIKSWIAYSVGGGKVVDDFSSDEIENIYPHKSMEEILEYCHEQGLSLWEYVFENEDDAFWPFLEEIWETMLKSIKNGLSAEGLMPGVLKLQRKASSYHTKATDMSGPDKKRSLVFSYALAVSEENASGGRIVTAPTCGACGVLPAVLYYYRKVIGVDKSRIIRALATAGLVGNLVKSNASISGAEVGCQGEVGTACAMASAAATQLSGGSNHQIEYSAEMGMEHHLGLTCDPVAGLVQIPCIERNAFAAARALNHNTYSLLSDGRHRISFDEVVEVMKQTGKDLPSFYKETSEGGLARFRGMPKHY